MKTFSATVRSGNRRGSWWTVAMPSERACAGPGSAPACHRARWCRHRADGCRPHLQTVLLPAPFSPTSPWISPGSRSSERPQAPGWRRTVSTPDECDRRRCELDGAPSIAVMGLPSLMTGSPVRGARWPSDARRKRLLERRSHVNGDPALAQLVCHAGRRIVIGHYRVSLSVEQKVENAARPHFVWL